MVFWISLALVLVGLAVLLVLLVELRAKQRRLRSTLDVAQKQVDQAAALVGALQQITPPRPPAKPARRALGLPAAPTIDRAGSAVR